MSRKGPDGRTLPGSEATAGQEDETKETTRPIARRSIKDRIATVDQATDAETRAVHRPDNVEGTAPTGDGDPSGYEETRLTDGDGTVNRSIPAGVGGATGASDPSAATTQPVEPTAMAAGGQDPSNPQGGGSAGGPVSPEVTQVYRPKRGDDQAAAGGGAGDESLAGSEEGADGLVADPVVGWLVVVEGPGRGTAMTIGYGNNRVGRDPAEDIVLDFGDGQISRENHAVITYDGKNRHFYIQQGAGRNLTHLNEQLVMTPVEMTGGEIVQMGDTKMRFVPLCSSEFDWYEEDAE